MVPAGQVALMVSARFGRDPPNITGGLHWRIYPDKPDANGVFRMLREERAAAPIFVLPPGGYVVHVSFGLATAAKKVQLRSETVRETFEIAAGGARFEGRVGDSRIPPGQITFDVFRGSQFEGGGGEQRALAVERRDRRRGAAARGHLSRRLELRRTATRRCARTSACRPAS